MDSTGPTTQGRFYASNLQRFKHGSTDKLVAENVTHGSDGLFRCAITGPGTCPFALPKMIQFTFACHFLRSHPKAAQDKGFLEQSEEVPTSRPVALSKFVIRTERGFCCRIDPSQTCDYVQKDQVSAQSFKRHFRLMHPVLARKHGFCNVWQSHKSSSILNSIIQQTIELDSTAKSAEPSSKKRKLGDEGDSEESSSDVILLDPSDENVWLDTPSDQPSEYCRLCFSIVRPSRPIFSAPEDTGSSCAALIEECTGVRLSAKEDFPAAICHECSEKLHDIKCFRMLCKTLNRVVRRNRGTSRKTPEIEVELAAVTAPSSPPPLVPFQEPVTTAPSGDELAIENADEDTVVELSDSDQDETVEDTPQEITSLEVSAEETDENLPYIALQDDWFCCKQCNQIHHTLDVMVDHLNNYHSELGFFAKPKPAAANFSKKIKKNKSKANKLATNTVDYQEVVIGVKTYFKCNDCDTLVSQKGNMSRHEKCYHKGGEQGPRLFCKVTGCNKNFMDRMGLTRHLKLQHSYDSIVENMGLQFQFDEDLF